jgi:hypothetical protein
MSTRLAALFTLSLTLTACPRAEVPPAVDASSPVASPPPAPAPVLPRDVRLDEAPAIEAVAREVLAAWRARDVKRLAALGPPEAASKLIFLEPDSEHWRAAFGDDSPFMRAVAAWDGRVLAIERGLDAAWVVFHEEPATRHAVEVHRFGERWGLHHLRQLPRPDRRGLTVTVPPPPPPPLTPPLAARP